MGWPAGGHSGQIGSSHGFAKSVIAVGGLFVQWVVNQNGVLFVAGYTATNKLYGLLELAAVSFGFAVSTFAGQNLGAGQIRRIRKGVRTAAWLGVGVAVVIAAAMLLFGKAIVACFVSGDTAQVDQVINIGYQYLCIMSWALPVLYLLHQYRSALQGMGNTVAAMVSGFFELFMRVLAVLTLPNWLGEVGIFYAEPLAWIGAVIVLAPWLLSPHTRSAYAIPQYIIRKRRVNLEMYELSSHVQFLLKKQFEFAIFP